jgi:uncharacterized protein YceH (UPF0502 family)
MDLSNSEIRVLGCLIEREATTPDHYPMTMNSLTAASNQKSNRSLVTEYTDIEVMDAVDRLRERGLALTVHGKGDSALKYNHVCGTPSNSLSGRPLCLRSLLRGPQTRGECSRGMARGSIAGRAR